MNWPFSHESSPKEYNRNSISSCWEKLRRSWNNTHKKASENLKLLLDGKEQDCVFSIIPDNDKNRPSYFISISLKSSKKELGYRRLNFDFETPYSCNVSSYPNSNIEGVGIGFALLSLSEKIITHITQKDSAQFQSVSVVAVITDNAHDQGSTQPSEWTSRRAIELGYTQISGTTTFYKRIT